MDSFAAQWQWHERAHAWDAWRRDLLALSERNLRAGLHRSRVGVTEDALELIRAALNAADIANADRDLARVAAATACLSARHAGGAAAGIGARLYTATTLPPAPSSPPTTSAPRRRELEQRATCRRSRLFPVPPASRIGAVPSGLHGAGRRAAGFTWLRCSARRARRHRFAVCAAA